MRWKRLHSLSLHNPINFLILVLIRLEVLRHESSMAIHARTDFLDCFSLEFLASFLRSLLFPMLPVFFYSLSVFLANPSIQFRGVWLSILGSQLSSFGLLSSIWTSQLLVVYSRGNLFPNPFHR